MKERGRDSLENPRGQSLEAEDRRPGAAPKPGPSGNLTSEVQLLQIGAQDQVADFSVASQLAQGRVLACPQPAV